MSAVDQLRQMVPDDWQLKPLRSVADYQVSNVDKLVLEGEEPVRLCNYVDVYHNEKVDLTLSFMPATATNAEIKRFGLRVGDVLITKDSESWEDIGIPTLISETADDLVCGYHLAMIRPNPDQIEGEFLLRCMQAKPVGVQLELAAYGITRFGIPKGAIGSLAIPVPPISTQKQIVRYIEGQAEDIDNLLEAKQNLLKLLAEKRRTVVAEAVMRGLDRAAPSRPSGIDWLGDIPAHWEALKLKWVVSSVGSGVSVNATDQPAMEGEKAVLKTSAVLAGRFIPHENKAVWPTELERLSCPVLANSIILSRMNTPTLVAQSGYVESDYPDLYLPDRLWQLRFEETRAYVPYFSDLLSSSILHSHIAEKATGTSASMKNLSQEDLLNTEIPLPPYKEQCEISEFISEERTKIDKLASATERSIALLKERRSALIAAAVTGQIEIPEAA